MRIPFWLVWAWFLVPRPPTFAPFGLWPTWLWPPPSPGMSEDRCVQPENRRYADPLDYMPGTGTGPPVILIGYWESDMEPGWPRVTDFVDELWDETERHVVASYLEQGFIPWVQAGPSWCRICGKANGTAERTDGVDIWPEGLAHYVREHGVRPPVGVIRHIISRAAMHPEQVDMDWWRTATLDS